VLDLASKAHPKSFLLKPGGGHGYRLVVDLYGKGGTQDAHISKRQSATRAAKLLAGARKVVVAVDAGHGGVDPGAHGPHGTQEKVITLKVAKDLAALIDKQPGMTAVLTRKGDYFVPLKRRYEIARKANADVFISVHADAYKSGDAKGSSVWVLSTHGKVSEAARWLADRQNRADLIGVSLDDKSDSLASVLLDMQQGYSIDASRLIANNVLKALARLGPTHRDHIERANFVVLRSPDVPSILVETAFITNPVGERKLRNTAYQKKLAHAVLSGVKKYFEATPPPGTWFAMQARKRRGEAVGTAAMAATGADVYKVGHGDTLSSIAQQYGVSVRQIKLANHMDDDIIRTGTVLTIPAG
jgi:N-acetylmuramoyl-L-alanine amidase